MAKKAASSKVTGARIKRMTQKGKGVTEAAKASKVRSRARGFAKGK